MRSCAFAAAVLAFGTSLSGCAAMTTTSKVAIDYNRIFAKSRDEVLVTNILRASAREPMQFSTMGTVSGTVRNSGSLTVPLTNLIGGTSGLTISPSTTVNDGINPTVSILPLSNKEFTEGILKAVTPETVNFFLNQGWDPEFVLTLVVGGVVCPNGGVTLFRGDKDDRFTNFAEMIGAVEGLPIRPKSKVAKLDPVRMSSKEAVAFLKDGVGKGWKVESIKPVVDQGKPTSDAMVTLVSVPDSEVVGLNTDKVCAGISGDKGVNADDYNGSGIIGVAGVNQGKILLRSVESIIYFLGETQRARWEEADCAGSGTHDRWPYYKRKRDGETTDITVLRIERACGGDAVPLNSFLSTRFNGRTYFIRRGTPDGTLTTLTFLNLLIALQTSESTITSTTPVLTIGTK